MSETKTRIFISGPMTGIEKYNFPEFDNWEYVLREIGGYEVINPANIARKYKVAEVLAHEEVFKKMVDEELDALEECSHIFLLDGWEKSEDARNEILAALELGLKIVVQKNVHRDFKLLESYQEVKNGRIPAEG